MSKDYSLIKRLIIYVIGIFLLGLCVTFFIISELGVPPIASFPYSITLTTGISVGITTVFSHFCYIIIQIFLSKKIKWGSFLIQLSIAVLFGIFIDFTGWLFAFLPEAESYVLKGLYLVLAIMTCALALVFYFTADLPMMPYDTLTGIIVDKFKLPFGKARVMSDISVVVLSLAICFTFLHSFGSIGVGTLIAAYSIGRVSGILMPRMQPKLKAWIYPASNILVDQNKQISN